MRTARSKRHMVADIDGCIAAAKRKDKMVLALLDQPSFASAIKDLEEMKADGFEVVPSADCDNQEYNGRCIGHQTWKDDES